MPAILSCPDAASLSRLMQGKFTGADGEALARHLEECPRCVEVVRRLPVEDTLIEAARAADMAMGEPDLVFVRGLIERLRGLHSSAVSDTSPVAASVALTPSPALTGEEGEALDFLAPPQAADEIGRLSGYRVLQLLGKGGMGMVFEVEDTQLKRRVALKVMKPTLAASATARQRFLREAQLAAAIEHDHIVTIHHVGEDRGVPFLAMPLLHGESLETRLKRETQLPLNDVLRIGREIALGLAAAHGRGLIHRDIKPANIWLERKDEGGRMKDETGQLPAAPSSSSFILHPSSFRVKILDFGLARAAVDDAHLTQSGAIVGTPAYMAPEQAQSKQADARADLFSLGCVLYRMSAGELPFKGDTSIAVLLSVAQDPPRPVRELNPDVPPPLGDLIMRLLAKDPRNRPVSAAVVATVLETLALQASPAPKIPVAQPVAPPPIQAVWASLSATEVTPKPQPPTAARKRWAPRRRSLAVAAAAAALVLLLGGVVLYWQTPQGTVRIEINDPDAKVTFDKNGLTITGADKNPITLKAGNHGIIVTRDDFTFETDKFVLKKGQTVTLKIEFLEGKVQVVQEGKVVAEGDVPLPKSFTNKLGMEFALVPKGKSWLGGGGGKPGDTEVEILHDFYLGKYEVTQEEWEKLMPNDPLQFTRNPAYKDFVKGIPVADLKRFPVDWVSWQDAQEFIERLNKQVKEPGWMYRLPKETEWEYACRGGPMAGKSESAFDYCCVKPANELLPEQANFNHGQFLKGPCKVGSYKPNPLGLYDMHGNVLEWCEERLDSKNAQGASVRVSRGGSWFHSSDICRAAGRFGQDERHGANFLGLRLARVPVGKKVVNVRPQLEGNGAADPDRRAAKWVLSIGGVVAIRAAENQQEQEVKDAKALPTGRFQLTLVGFWDNKKLTDSGLENLKGLTNLTHFWLGYCWQMGDTGVKHLEGLTSLKELNLRDTQVSDAGLEHLKGLTNLTSLSLPWTRVTGTGFVHLKDLTNLTYLDLWSCPHVKGDGLENLKQLTWLQLGHTRMSDDGLKHLKALTKLTQLYLAYTQVGSAGLEQLKGQTKLTHLDLSGTPVGDAGLEHLKELKQLEVLNLGVTQVSGVGLEHLKGLTNLRELSLTGTPVSDTGLQHLKGLTNLTGLDLRDTQVSGAGLEHLTGLTKPTSLGLSGTPVSDAGLAHLKALTNLTYLDLTNTKVTDAGLAHLKDCKSLTALHLSHTRVSDAGLEVLAEQGNLRELHLENSRISRQGYDQLKAALPNRNILWSEPNRKTAEQVLELGGVVEIATPGKDDARPVKAANALPKEFFQVRRISLKGVKKPLDELAATVSQLRFAEFDRLEAMDLSGATPRDFTFLARIAGLKELTLSGTALQDFAFLTAIPELKDLTLAGAGLNDDHLAKFPKLPQLRRLVLDDNPIHGPGLGHLQNQPELIDLSLNCPTITDLLAKNLAELKRLKRLSLVGANLNDAGIRHLEELTNLTALDLRKTKASAAGIDRLRQALPPCRIEWDGGVIEPKKQ